MIIEPPPIRLAITNDTIGGFDSSFCSPAFKELSMWDFWVLEEIASRVLAGVAGCVIGVLGTLFFQWVF